MKRLTAKFVAEVEAPGRHYDGDAGLFLFVHSAISKSYVQRVTIQGKRRDIGLGSVRWTTLTEARAAAQENRRIARHGGDPLALRRPATPTFREAADAVIEMHRAGWRDSGKSEHQWRASLETYAFPRLGDKRVDQITTAEVLCALLPHWHDKYTTMKRVRQRIGAIMKWAIAHGHRPDDPTGPALGAALPKNGRKQAHHKALPYGEVGAALAKVRASKAWTGATLALEFLTLAACRSGEVRGATWNEIDLGAREWRIPGDRIKGGVEHRVPLSSRALAVLGEARPFSGGEGLVFPSSRGGAMAGETLAGLLRELEIGCVPHGMRSSFRDWAAECTDAPREVCELALAHVNSDRVEAAYRRSDLFDRRRELMQDWADYISA